MDMLVRLDVVQLEDQVLKPLHNILMLTYGTTVHQAIKKEVMHIITALEKEQLIRKRSEVKRIWN